MKIKTFSHNVMVDNKIVTLKFDITFSAKTKEFEAIVPETTRVVSSIKEVFKGFYI